MKDATRRMLRGSMTAGIHVAVLLLLIVGTRTTSMLAQSSTPVAVIQPPDTVPIPGSTIVPPGGQVTFLRPGPPRAPGEPVRPGGGGSIRLVVSSRSDQRVTATYDGSTLTITAPDGFVVVIAPIAGPSLSGECQRVGGHANVVQCPVSGSPAPAEVAFTTVASSTGIEAALDLADPRPCIPEFGESDCDGSRAALWNGEASAWAARGVADPDARFNETVVFRVRGGDPAAIRNIARILGQPYLKITHLRFLAALPEREFVEITNLGSAAQDMTGWTVRSVARGLVASFPAGFTLEAGQSCRVYTTTLSADAYTAQAGACGDARFLPGDVWPDDAGTAVLFYDALALLADETRYSADPRDQPPPPNLQLVRRD